MSEIIIIFFIYAVFKRTASQNCCLTVLAQGQILQLSNTKLVHLLLLLYFILIET